MYGKTLANQEGIGFIEKMKTLKLITPTISHTDQVENS